MLCGYTVCTFWIYGLYSLDIRFVHSGGIKSSIPSWHEDINNVVFVVLVSIGQVGPRTIDN